MAIFRKSKNGDAMGKEERRRPNKKQRQEFMKNKAFEGIELVTVVEQTKNGVISYLTITPQVKRLAESFEETVRNQRKALGLC
jgi:hypothetical protein